MKKILEGIFFALGAFAFCSLLMMIICRSISGKEIWELGKKLECEHIYENGTCIKCGNVITEEEE